MRKRAMLLAAIAFVAGGTAPAKVPRRPEQPGAAAKAARPTDQAARRDAAVIEAALNDLRSLKASESPVEGWSSRLNFYLEMPRPADYPEPRDILQQSDPKDWKNLSPDQLLGAKEAAKSLARRVQTADAPKPFVPKSNALTLLSRKEAEARIKARMTPNQKYYRQVFGVFPPGYSPDGRYAVVYLDFPWSAYHGGNGTFVLTRRGDQWKVLLRQFLYYV